VVLALSASLLVLGVLEHFAAEHAAIANRGIPVVGLWAGLQIVAVALAETTGRAVFWWLEPHPAPHRACRWGVLPPARQLVRRLRFPVRAPVGAPVPGAVGRVAGAPASGLVGIVAGASVPGPVGLVAEVPGGASPVGGPQEHPLHR